MIRAKLNAQISARSRTYPRIIGSVNSYHHCRLTTFDTTILSAEHVWVQLKYNVVTGHVIASGKLRWLRHVFPDKRTLKTNSMRLLFLKQQRQEWLPFYDAVIRVDELGCMLKFENAARV